MANTQVPFKQTLKTNFDFLKDTVRFDDLMAKAIPIERGDQGYLIPVTKLHLQDPKASELWSKFKAAPPMIGPGFTDSAVKASHDHEQFFVVVDQFNNERAVLKVAGIDHGSLRVAQIAQLVPEVGFNVEALKLALRRLGAWLKECLVADQVVLGEVASDAASTVTSLGFERGPDSWRLKFDESSLGRDEILTAGPTITSRESSYALDACRYGWNSEWAKYIKKFEASFAAYIGTKYALTTSSCTGALHIAFSALDLKAGDEVIVPEITWVATASAVRYVGATPVFAEVDKNNWCLDPEKLESKITSKTKCIVPVHTYGHPCDMDRIMEIANKHGLYVVEDAAPAIGAECRGRKTGSYGHFAAFSFQGAKMLVTGEGGMLVCNSPELYEKAYRIWDHGRTPGTFWINSVGYKYKMANILAAIGLAQLERCEEQILAKRRIADWYYDELKDFDGVRLWRESDWARSIYWMSSLVINPDYGVSREDFFKFLKGKKIDTRPAFPAISQYPMWSTDPQPVAKEIGDWGVNLPSGVLLQEEQVRYVARNIREALQSGRKK